MLVFLVCVSMGQPRKTIYVSPNGNDNSRGYAGSPLRTVKAAFDRMRTERFHGSGMAYTIDIAPGRYQFDEPLKVWSYDSGTAQQPTIVRGYEGTQFDGSLQITGWRRVSGDAWRRLSMSARANVYMAPIPLQDNGSGQMVPVDTGQMNQRRSLKTTQQTWSTLVFNDSPMTLAQYPNEGWLYTPWDHDGSNTSFGLSNNVLYSWVDTGDVWVHGYLGWDWSNSYERIDYVDTVNARVHLATTPVYGVTANKRYRFVNALEAIDSPGEYFIDRQNGAIYFYPPLNGLDNETKLAYLNSGTFMPWLDKSLVESLGASNVVFKNITFQNGRHQAVHIYAGDRVQFNGCTFKNFNLGAAVVSNGSNHRFQSCDFTGIGETALVVRGGDRSTLTPSGHVVDNCWFRDFSSVVRSYTPAIKLEGVGHMISQNRFEDSPHSAVIIHGNDHRIIGNEFSGMCLETNDSGAIYIGRNMTYQGNVIQHNLFEDLWTQVEGDYSNFVVGVYLDDMSSGSDVSMNVFKNVQIGVSVGGGRDNTLDNNLFFNNGHALAIDARGTTWASNFREMWNVDSMFAEVPHQSQLWIDRYGDIGRYLWDLPGVPMRNSLTHNVSLWSPEWVLLLSGLQMYPYPGTNAPVYESLNFIGHWNPGFYDIAKNDFRIFGYSALNRYGILPVDLSSTGLYIDSYRYSLQY